MTDVFSEFFDAVTESPEPRTIKRDGYVGFRGAGVKFFKGSQTIEMYNATTHVALSIADFLNLVEQATWYFDQFASREEK